MEINEQKKLEITAKVESLLRTQFSGQKAESRFHRDRLNFSCPYCGDSMNGHKKRANIYWKNLMKSVILMTMKIWKCANLQHT